MNLRTRLDADREDGFTLIELLIVIVILGILAGIVTFGVAQFRTDSTLQACKTDKKNVETAQAAHNAKTGAFAASVGALVTANYLKSAPGHGIATDATGAVTSTVASC